MRQWRVGTFSMGIILITLGAVMLTSHIKGMNALEQILKWWPSILVVLGIEILLHISFSKDEHPKIKFDGFSIFIITTIMIISVGAYTFTSAISVVKGYPSVFSEFDLYLHESKFDKSFTIDAKGIDKLILENSNGNVRMIKGDSETIEIEANITIKHNDETDEYVTQVADSIVEITKSDSVRVNTKSGHYADRTSDSNKIFINYFVKVPEHMNIDVQNKFGEVTVEGITLSAAVKNPNGTTTLKDIGTDVKVDSSFGDVNIEDIKGNALLYLKNGTLNAKNVEGSLDGTNNFGSIELNYIKGNVMLESSNGNIKAEHIEGTLIVNGKFGDMDFYDIGGNVDIHGKNCEIYLENAGGDVKIINGFGKIEVINANKLIDINGANGEILMQAFKPIEKDLNIVNKFGSVTLKLPGEQNGNFDVKTSFGSIKSEFDIGFKNKANEDVINEEAEKSLSGILIDDNIKLTVSTSNGDINIEKN